MGFFSKDTKTDALKRIDKINQEMRAVVNAVHACGGMICSDNKYAITQHLQKAWDIFGRYEQIKKYLMPYEQVQLNYTYITCWNNERINVYTWETYFVNVSLKLTYDLKHI